MAASKHTKDETKKTSTMTLRLEDKMLKILRTEPKRHQISLNTFVNQILKPYVQWDMFEPKVGMIPIPKPMW
jgi:predicted HicB family RNase H-like nuclease